MVEILGKDCFMVNINPGKSIEIIEIVFSDTGRFERILRLECNDMFALDSSMIGKADIIMLETDIPNHLQDNLCLLLSKIKEGAHALTYLDLRKNVSYNALHFRQLESNKSLSDRFPTSWSVQRGHHFFLWIKDFKENKNLFMNGSSSSMFNENNSDITEFENKSQSKLKNSNSSDQIATTHKPSWGSCLPFNIRNFFG